MTDESPTLTIEERIERAQKMVHALCQGEERWIMHVPARPDRDPDLVIADGLKAGQEAAALIVSLREALAQIAAPAKTAEELRVSPGMDYWCTVATRRQDIADAALRTARALVKPDEVEGTNNIVSKGE